MEDRASTGIHKINSNNIAELAGVSSNDCRMMPLIRIDLLIQDKRNKNILLAWCADSNFGMGWCLPGGIIHYKKTIAQCINEIAQSQLGIKIEFEQSPVFVMENIALENDANAHSISIVYRCRLQSKPDEINRLTPASPLSGQWSWHRQCPPNLIPQQKNYSCLFPSPNATKRKAFLHLLTSHVPPGQLGRYLIVGVWNTAFAYGSFALFTALLDKYIPASYMVGSLLSSLLNITVSFLGYKWFVFKTKGNYLREWFRCLMVYSGSIVLGLILLPPTVLLVTHATDDPKSAPYIAGALLTVFNVIISFVGHKNFSFRNAKTEV